MSRAGTANGGTKAAERRASNQEAVRAQVGQTRRTLPPRGVDPGSRRDFERRRADQRETPSRGAAEPAPREPGVPSPRLQLRLPVFEAGVGSDDEAAGLAQ
jgi:hypothetical protein